MNMIFHHFTTRERKNKRNMNIKGNHDKALNATISIPSEGAGIRASLQSTRLKQARARNSKEGENIKHQTANE